jgi:hypothetical protein
MGIPDRMGFRRNSVAPSPQERGGLPGLLLEYLRNNPNN